MNKLAVVIPANSEAGSALSTDTHMVLSVLAGGMTNRSTAEAAAAESRLHGALLVRRCT